ncbi:site-2 protease family protein [Hydrogenophilus thermoluteolus]|uniref:site-2 protease family protein n=1 Tax=Hydrogenophilus thermoluteolus TaxID=297 RepID=UPI003F66B43A
MRAQVTLEVVPERDGRRFGRLGVQARAPDRDAFVRRVVYAPTEALLYGWEQTLEMAGLTLKLIGKMLVGEASVKNLSGPLTIATVAGQSAELGWAHYLSFLALVSVSLGVLNLLPIPILDGGICCIIRSSGCAGGHCPTRRKSSDSASEWRFWSF